MAVIIFDFDGTIVDSFDYVAHFLLDGIAPENAIDTQSLRGMSMMAMARLLGYSYFRLPGLLIKGRNHMAHSIKKLQPFTGMPEVIAKLHAEGHELFIVSSNSIKNVRAFLHYHELHQYFLEIYGGVGPFGKAPVLRKLLRTNSFDRTQAIYVGDELRDVEAAQAIGLRVIAVTWGFARPSDLYDKQPTAVVATPDELFKALEEI